MRGALPALLAAASAAQAAVYTTNAGAPVDNARHSLTVGARGPTLLQDHLLVERIQVHNRERVPERNMHARGSTAKGHFRLTQDWSNLTMAKVFHRAGKTTPIAVRFSTTIHGLASPEWLRDPCGFALKLYTEEGNYDIVGLNYPIFFLRDGLRFPDMGRALKPSPLSGAVEWWRRWDYFVNYPESTQMFTWLLDDIGIPTTWRHMDGWGMHTYKWVSAEGKETWVRYTWDSHACRKPLSQGCGFQSDEDAEKEFFSYRTVDIHDTIARGEPAKWTLYVQTLDPSDRQLIGRLGIDPLDVTREWDPAVLPLREVGEFSLTENPVTQFLENEQIAFAPSRMVPGVEPSDDQLLQARLFAYVDAQRYRLGVNNQMLPINRPQCPYVDQHFDGAMNFATDLRAQSRAAGAVDYFPSAMDGSLEEAPAYPHESERVGGQKVREPIPPQRVSDFQQAGDRYRGMDAARQDRLAHRIALTLTGDRLSTRVRDAVLGNMKQVDTGLERRIQHYLAAHLRLKGATAANTSDEVDLGLLRFRDSFRRTAGLP
eukprot:TRINITY_DN15_c1_g1_i1.p1 TRINITY_DN15_c1_g1~~TRINITY_DN15_c1_g1_i1.p1  ORF type:complete len:567 (+),score=188.29 TRINITY_DN15_c1_g1_i1:74-1702(+)